MNLRNLVVRQAPRRAATLLLAAALAACHPDDQDPCHVQHEAPGDVVEIAVGPSFACARRGGGTVVCWGANESGQLGDGSQGATSAPVAVEGLWDAVSISAGRTHACAARANGDVVCWGDNSSGQLGDGTEDASRRPVEMQRLWTAPAVQVAAGDGRTAVLDEQGVMYFAGGGSLPSGERFTQISAGTDEESGFCGVQSGGERSGLAWCSGITVLENEAVAEVSGGLDAGCGRSVEGGVWHWFYYPVSGLETKQIAGIDDAIDVSGRGYFGCAVREGGRVACWGYNDPIGFYSPEEAADIPDLGDATQVAVSGGEDPFACALRRNGSVACWGENGAEQVTAGTCSGVSVKRPRTILGLDVLPPGSEPATCDYDGDGFAAPSDDCDGDDCADEDASAHPGAADDVGDEVDQSCDGIDGVDGDGDAEASLETGGTDCDDGDPEIGQRGHPDVPNDGVDQNCDGIDPIDADGDGFVSIASAGDDCDDADPAVFPLAEGDWLREHVDDGIGVPSLAIDLLGAAHAAYFAVEDERGLVRHATNDSGEWIVSDVGADEDNIGGFPRLKVDEDGVAHIVYEAERRDDTAFLRYASNASGSWAIEDVGRTLDSEWSIFGPVTLAIGADREPHVVWIDTSGDLVHAVRRDGVWDRETIASGIGVDWYGSDPALSIDAAGALHVSYTQIFEDRDALLRHASNAGGQWRFDTIDQLGIWSRLATSAAGIVHAVYAFAPEGCNAGACDLTPRHATYTDGAWETEDIEGYGDFAVDEAGLLHVSAFAGYLTNAGGGWSHERLFERVEERPIPPCTLALDPDGLPHLACQLTRVTQDPDDEGVNHFFRGIPDGRDDDCDGAAW